MIKSLLAIPKFPDGVSNLESSKWNLEFLSSNCLAGLKRESMVLVLFIQLFGIWWRPKISYLVEIFQKVIDYDIKTYHEIVIQTFTLKYWPWRIRFFSRFFVHTICYNWNFLRSIRCWSLQYFEIRFIFVKEGSASSRFDEICENRCSIRCSQGGCGN